MTNQITRYETTPYEIISDDNWSAGLRLIYKDNIKGLTKENEDKFEDENIYSTIDSIVDNVMKSKVEKNNKNSNKFEKTLKKVANRSGMILRGGLAGAIVGTGIGYFNGNIQEGATLGAEYGLILGVSEQLLIQGIWEGVMKPVYNKFKKHVQHKYPSYFRNLNAFEVLMHETTTNNPRLMAEFTILNQVRKQYDKPESIKDKAINIALNGGMYALSAVPYNILANDNIKLKIAFSIGVVDNVIKRTYKHIITSATNNNPNIKELNKLLSTLDKDEKYQLIGGLLNHWHEKPSYEIDFVPTRP